MEGAFSLAILNNAAITFSDSPTNLETISEEEIEKNVALISVAHAFAKTVFPVPGGPYNKIPFQGFNNPLNIWGYYIGSVTASSSNLLAGAKPAISSHFTLGLSVIIALSI